MSWIMIIFISKIPFSFPSQIFQPEAEERWQKIIQKEQPVKLMALSSKGDYF